MSSITLYKSSALAKGLWLLRLQKAAPSFREAGDRLLELQFWRQLDSCSCWSGRTVNCHSGQLHYWDYNPRLKGFEEKKAKLMVHVSVE